jgi:hypothetical protein
LPALDVVAGVSRPARRRKGHSLRAERQAAIIGEDDAEPHECIPNSNLRAVLHSPLSLKLEGVHGMWTQAGDLCQLKRGKTQGSTRRAGLHRIDSAWFHDHSIILCVFGIDRKRESAHALCVAGKVTTRKPKMTDVELEAAAEKLDAAASRCSGDISQQFKDRADQLRSNAFNYRQWEKEPGGVPADVAARYEENALQFLAMIGRRGDH